MTEGEERSNPLGGIRSTYPGPRARISRDRSLAWWRRVLPVVLSHRVAFGTAIGLSFLSLIFQTLIPNMLNGAINHALIHHTSPLHTYVVEIIIVGVLAGVTGAISRQNLFKTAYNLEADLRSLIYEHLTWLSFSFYDRVQSGQLISRANSDIRSVQMYSVFAPLIIVQAFIGVVAFVFMLSIDVELALIAMVVMPILYVVGLKMRRVMFPISWITQARLAEVATVSTRTSTACAWSRPSPRRRPRSTAWPTPPKASPGPTSRTPRSAACGRPGSRTSPSWASPWCSSSAGGWSSRATSGSGPSWRSTPTC